MGAGRPVSLSRSCGVRRSCPAAGVGETSRRHDADGVQADAENVRGGVIGSRAVPSTA